MDPVGHDGRDDAFRLVQQPVEHEARCDGCDDHKPHRSTHIQIRLIPVEDAPEDDGNQNADFPSIRVHVELRVQGLDRYDLHGFLGGCDQRDVEQDVVVLGQRGQQEAGLGHVDGGEGPHDFRDEPKDDHEDFDGHEADDHVVEGGALDIFVEVHGFPDDVSRLPRLHGDGDDEADEPNDDEELDASLLRRTLGLGPVVDEYDYDEEVP